MFSLLPLDYVIIHANDDILNTATGYMEKKTLLSVKIDRATLDKLNLELIDCSDAMQNFEHNMKFLKTKGLQPVEKSHSKHRLPAGTYPPGPGGAFKPLPI